MNEIFRKSLIWMGISLGISITLGIFFGLYGTIAAVAIFILMLYYFSKNPAKAANMFGSPKETSKEGYQSTGKWYCGACGKELKKNERECSRCGSKWSRHY